MAVAGNLSSVTLASHAAGTTIALVVVMFALADELPDPRVRLGALTVGGGLTALVGTAMGASSGSIRPAVVLVALGPLVFLTLHHVLRRVFLRWKGEEPVLCYHPRREGDRSRFRYEPERTDRVTVLDYLYSFLVGAAMLLSVLPAIHIFVTGGT